MKKVLVSLTLFLALTTVHAQDGTVRNLKKDSEKTFKKDPNDTIPKTWRTGGLFNLNINQGSLSNWSAGGDKFSFSLNAYLSTYAYFQKDRHSWDNSLELAYGIVNTTSLGNRKSSDRIDLTSKYGYALNSKLNLAALTNLRTQFANGFSYTESTTGKDSASLTSKTFAPAYVLVSLGLDYQPAEY
ncbi:MAG: DUF3078 domain-containing protein, partial [Pedobacter sp.]